MYYVYNSSNMGYQLINLQDLSIREISEKKFEMLVRLNPDDFVNVNSGTENFYLDNDDMESFEEDYDDSIYFTDTALSDCDNVFINVKDIFMYSNDATFKISNRRGRLGVSYANESEFTLFSDEKSIACLKEGDYDASIRDIKFSFIFIKNNILVFGLRVCFYNNSDWYPVNVMYDIKLKGFCDIKPLDFYVSGELKNKLDSVDYISQLMLDSEFSQLVNMR